MAQLMIPAAVARKVVIEGLDTRTPRVVIDPEWAGRSISIPLGVTDRGDPSLTPYGRVFHEVKGSGPGRSVT